MIYRKDKIPADLQRYFVRAEIGLEATPAEFVAKLVEVFREVRRVLRDDGTLWLNLGDSYGAVGGNTYAGFNERWSGTGGAGSKQDATLVGVTDRKISTGLKPKNLLGIPWRVAFALQADGWYLRQDLIWAKPNPMPESVRDRCTKAHEYVFLLSKSERYFYDADAIKEPAKFDSDARYERGRSNSHKYADGGPGNQTIARSFEHMARSGNKARKAASERGVPVDTGGKTAGAVAGSVPWEGSLANKRSVWTIATEPYPEAHFATFPTELPRLCILAGSRPGDTVLDPFNGSGTTGQVALELGRHYIGIELNPEYVELTNERLRQITIGLPLEAA